MKKIFTVAFMRDLEKQLNKGEISYSRMVEILNETANEAIKEANDEKEKLISALWSERSDLKHRFGKEVWEGYIQRLDNYTPDFRKEYLGNIPTMSVSEAEEALKSISERNPKNERSFTIKEMDEALKEFPSISDDKLAELEELELQRLIRKINYETHSREDYERADYLTRKKRNREGFNPS